MITVMSWNIGKKRQASEEQLVMGIAAALLREAGLGALSPSANVGVDVAVGSRDLWDPIIAVFMCTPVGFRLVPPAPEQDLRGHRVQRGGVAPARPWLPRRMEVMRAAWPNENPVADAAA